MKNRRLQLMTPVVLTLAGISGQGHAAAAVQAPPSALGQSATQTKSAPSASTTGITGPGAQGSNTGRGNGTSGTGSSGGTGTMTPAMKRAALVKLLSSPDSTVVNVNGKPISAGQLRQGIRSAGSSFNRTPKVGGGRTVPAAVNASSLATANRSLLTALQQAVGSSGSHPKVTQTSAVADLNKPCSQRAPYIAEMKGTLTPGGMITFEGECLGTTQGEVRLYGDFPNGFARLQVQLWADVGVAATVPADLNGVLDQSGRLEVVRADTQVSNDRKANFTATRVTQQVPVQLVQLITCTDYPNDCADQSASHISLDGDDGASGQRTGGDSWKVAVGNGWALQNLSVTDQIGSTTSTGFDQGPSTSAQFNIAWVGGVLSSTTTHYAFWDLVGSTETTYLASYAFTVTAVGPAGVSPDPSVKPPYAGHAVQAGNSVTALQDKAPTPPPTPVQNLEQQAAKPVWNTIIGTGGNGSSTVSSSTRVKATQLQGQPTSVAPGAPVQAPSLQAH
jgi:hypothetical protein